MKHKFILEILKQTKIKVMIIILLSLVNSYFISLIPLYIKYALDGVVYSNETIIPNYISMFFWNTSWNAKLIVICVFLFFINLIISITRFLRDKIVTKFKIQINKNVREKVLRKAGKLTYSTFFCMKKSEITQRTNGDINTFISFFDVDLIMLFDLFFVLTFALYNTFKLNFAIGVYLVICMILLISGSIIYFKKSKKIAEDKVKANEELIAKENNLIKNIKMIKMYGKEKIEKKNFLDRNKEYNKRFEKLLRTNTIYHIFCHVINITSVPFVVTIGGIFIAKGILSIGTLVAILEYRASILERCSKLSQKYQNINQFYIAYKNLKGYMELPEDEEVVEEYKLKGNIVFKNVSIFLNQNCILENLNFTIEKGKSYALVGDNGSGKSILLKTILGLYDYSGDIFIGDINLKEISSTGIIKNISFISESPFLFNTSILNNIILDKKNTNIIEITKMCEIYNEIVNFENGFDTVVNENLNLSGGQKQRIAISRALYQEKNYLLFDDSFSKLDTITKNKLLYKLQMLDKTIIVATYDYYTIKKLKNVLFINDKTIISSTYEKIEKENELFRKLIDISRNKLGEEYE